MGSLSPCFVRRGQYWLVYLPMLYVMNKKWLVYHPVLSVMDSNSLYISLFILSWTKLVGISTGLVCCGQYLLLYQPVLSVMDNIGRYIPLFCLS